MQRLLILSFLIAYICATSGSFAERHIQFWFNLLTVHAFTEYHGTPIQPYTNRVPFCSFLSSSQEPDWITLKSSAFYPFHTSVSLDTFTLSPHSFFHTSYPKRTCSIHLGGLLGHAYITRMQRMFVLSL